jgi:hypothetical protein
MRESSGISKKDLDRLQCLTPATQKAEIRGIIV